MPRTSTYRYERPEAFPMNAFSQYENRKKDMVFTARGDGFTGPDRRRSMNKLGQIPGITDAIKIDVSLEQESAVMLGIAIFAGVAAGVAAASLVQPKRK